MKYINGWTKETVIAQFKKYNDNTKCRGPLGCLYESGLGNRCAIGCFLGDDAKQYNYLGGVVDLLRKNPTLESLMPFEGEELQKFQSAHDCSAFVGTYKAIEHFLDNN